ncbi:MAG: molybdenum ABC transporter ATP-binding protein [Gammaproteobacteria bacterium]|nr:MAG: molybdenum ABC transporter ATP-binding protein [Gammaproteobacteria bacterium]
MISFDFNHQQGDFPIEASGQFPLTGITALFGDSGCGKSSLLRLMAGLEGKNSGTFTIDKNVLQDQHQWLTPWQRNLGYVAQQSSLFPHLTILQNLQYAEKRRQGTGHGWSREQIIEHFGIEHLLQRMPSQLSGGQQQRVTIARALLGQPSCLLLDEPVSALDEAARFDLLSRLQTLSKEKQLAILYVSHDRREVAQLADYILMMEAGKIVAHGDYQSMATDLCLPFAHGKDAISVLPVSVGKESEDHLTELLYGDEVLWVRASQLTLNSQMRLQIPANEVSLSLEQNLNTSVLNQLPVIIVDLGQENRGQQIISIKTQQHTLLARITSRSVSRLNLQVGMKCFASFKAVAVSL